MTASFPGMEPPRCRPRAKPRTPYPEEGFTPEERLRIRQYCRWKAPEYLPTGKPGGLNDLMAAMKNYYLGEGAHLWKRNWVRAAYNWILQQKKFDSQRAQRFRAEKPQMARAKQAEQVIRKDNSLQTIVNAIGREG